MPDANLTPNEVRLKQLADRYAVVMTYLWAHFDTTEPFTNDDFWISDDCMEIRTMPEYQEQMNLLRVAL